MVEILANGDNTKLVYDDIYQLKTSFLDSKLSTNCIRISPDGTKLATCSSDCLIRVYDIKELLNGIGNSPVSPLILAGHQKGVSCLEFSPINSNIIVSCSDDLTIRIWSIDSQKCVKILTKHTYHITTVKFNTKGNLLISGSADENITIWDVSNGKPIKTLAAHSDPILSLSLTPDDSIIISASYDGLMRLFDTNSGQCLKTLTINSSTHGTATALTNDVVNYPISNVECSPNGKYILSSSLDGTIRLWNYMNNKVVKTYTLVNDDIVVVPICEKFSCGTRFITKNPTRSLIISGSDKSGIIIWDIQTKKIVSKLDTHPEATKTETANAAVLDLDIYDEGKLLVCCTRDGRVSIYEMNKEYIDIPNNSVPAT